MQLGQGSGEFLVIRCTFMYLTCYVYRQGPARCYRRAANTLKTDAASRSLLCVNAGEEDPAVCLAAGERCSLLAV